MNHVTYLDAKRPLDDRSLDRDVLSRFESLLPATPTILEVGGGTATMAERLYEWGVVDSGRWVVVDSHADALEAGRRRLAAREDSTTFEEHVELDGLTVEFHAADAFEYAAATDDRFDAVVGCAFFDIVDIEPAVSALSPVSDLVYAPITYDGMTRFDPAIPEDEAVLRQYHEHMREYRAGGPEGATALASALTVLADGDSSWIIEPPYTDGERTVLEHLIDTVESAVGETGYDAGEWARRRRAALSADRLRYEAANRDILARL